MIQILLVCLSLLAWLPAPAAADVFDDAPADEGGQVARYDPDGEFLRSLLLPGWSQFRQDRSSRGVGYLTVAMVSLVFVTGVIDVPWVSNDKDNFGQVLAGAFYGLNAVMSAFDARRGAVESNRENGWDLPDVAVLARPGPRLVLVRVQF